MIHKFIILQTLFTAKTVYDIENIKVDKKSMKELNELIIEDFNNLIDEDEGENKNDSSFINAKKEFEFIIKHDDISHKFLSERL